MYEIYTKLSLCSLALLNHQFWVRQFFCFGNIIHIEPEHGPIIYQFFVWRITLPSCQLVIIPTDRPKGFNPTIPIKLSNKNLLSLSSSQVGWSFGGCVGRFCKLFLIFLGIYWLTVIKCGKSFRPVALPINTSYNIYNYVAEWWLHVTSNNCSSKGCV